MYLPALSEKEVYGELNTTLHGNFKYIPDLTILNSADAKIVYINIQERGFKL